MGGDGGYLKSLLHHISAVRESQHPRRCNIKKPISHWSAEAVFGAGKSGRKTRSSVDGIDAADDRLDPLLVQPDAIGVAEELGAGGGGPAPPHDLVHTPWIGPIVQQAQDNLQRMSDFPV